MAGLRDTVGSDLCGDLCTFFIEQGLHPVFVNTTVADRLAKQEEIASLRNEVLSLSQDLGMVGFRVVSLSAFRELEKF